ncbi:hypothetical protein [Campylobacter canadensis]|uniref:hypothetical protein n=1 Tax=Campylobacter canadensis TaxID=449520 RepID=UPI001CCC2CEE|nr:hypothetical protein [Campylobacter canadensis]MBZ8002367.1 hypothetical protein [Campylobacter canadensis]
MSLESFMRINARHIEDIDVLFFNIPIFSYTFFVIIPIITFMLSARTTTLADIYKRVTDLNCVNPVPFAVIWYRFIFRYWLYLLITFMLGVTMQLIKAFSGLTSLFYLYYYVAYPFLAIILFYIMFVINYNAGGLSLISPILYLGITSSDPYDYNTDKTRIIITVVIFLFLLFINFNYFKTKAIIKSIIRNCYILIADKVKCLLFFPLEKYFKIMYFGKIESITLWIQVLLISKIIYDKINYKHAYSIMHNILEFCTFDRLIDIIFTPSIFIIYAIPTIIKYYLKTIMIYEISVSETNKYGFFEAIRMGWKNALENADGSVVKALYFPEPFKDDEDKFSMLD